MASSIYEEFLQAAKSVSFAPQKKGETENDYILRLLRAINSIPDEVWNALSEEAQVWYNKACATTNSLNKAPLPPGFEEAQETTAPAPVEEPAPTPVVASQPVEQPIVAEPATESTKTERKPPEPSKPMAKAAAASANGPTTTSTQAVQQPKKPKYAVTAAIRKAIIQHPDWDETQIRDSLVKDEGIPEAAINLDTLSVNYSNIQAVIKLAKELGHWA